MHGLAGTVDAPLGPGQNIDRARCRTTGDTAVGEVEAGPGHVEEDVVVGTAAGSDHRRRQGCAAAHETGIEACAAFGISRGSGEDLVVLGNQLQLDVGERAGRCQRAGKDVQAVGAGKGREADVGDDEPLCRAAVPVLGHGGWRDGGQHIDAGLAGGQRFLKRDAGDDFPVLLGGDVQGTLPDEFADLVLHAAGSVAVHLGEELRGGEERGDVAVTDPVEFEIGAFRVHRNERNALPGGGRQDETVTCEADAGAAVTDIDFELDRRFQVFVDGGGQAGAKGKPIAAAMLQPFYADLVVLGFECLWCLAVQGDEGGVVDTTLDQRFGELDAGARRGAVGIDSVVHDAKSLAGTEILEGGFDFFIRREFKARLVGA